MSDSFEDKLIKEFEQGKLPPEFLDKERIVDPNDPVAREFSEYMQRIAKRLLGPSYDPVADPITFLLSAHEEPNAFIVSVAQPPVVAFTKGLLKRLTTEDQVAAILGHELEHEHFHNRFGRHMNSKMEESAADVGSMLALSDAGYQPEAMKEALAALPLPTKDLFTRIISAYDPHPEMHTRVRNVEDAQVWLERNKGRSKVQPTPFEGELKDRFTSVERPSDFSLKLQDMGFEQADPAHKIEMISGLIQSDFTNLNGYNAERATELAGVVSKLTIDKNDPAQLQALDQLLEQLAVKPQNGFSEEWKATSKKILNATNEAWDTTNGPEQASEIYVNGELIGSGWSESPGGDFYTRSSFQEYPGRTKYQLEAQQAFENFVNASTADEITRYAAELDRVVDKYDFANSPLLDMGDYRVKKFTLPFEDDLHEVEDAINGRPSRRRRRLRVEDEAPPPVRSPEEYAEVIETHGIKPSWDTHVGVAVEQQSQAVIEALQHCGVEDPRIPARRGDIAVITRPETPTNQNPLSMDGVYISPSGKIFAERPYIVGNITPEEETGESLQEARKSSDLVIRWATDHERKRLNNIDAIHNAVLPTVNWQELEHDFWGFAHKYKNYLRPEPTVLDGGDTFARAFMEHCDELVRKDPEKFKPLVYEFITGRPPGTTLDYKAPEDEYPPHNNVRSLYDENVKRAGRTAIKLDRQYSELLPRGMSIDHPYIMAMTNDPHGMFSSMDKSYGLDRARFLDIGDDPRTPANKIVDPAKWFESPSRLLGYEVPQNIAELNAILLRHMPSTEAELQAAAEHAPGSSVNFFLANAMTMEASRLLAQPDLRITRDELRFLSSLNHENVLDGGQTIRKGWRDKDKTEEKKTGRLTELSEQLREHELAATTPVSDTIDGYFYLSNTDHRQPFLQDPELRKRYEDKIRHDIDAIGDTHARTELLRELLFSRSLPEIGLRDTSIQILPRDYTPDFTSPEFREWAMDGYIEGEAKILGKDDGSAEYRKRLIALVDDISEHTSGVAKHQLLAGIVDKVDAQKEASYHARDKVLDIDINRIMEYHMKSAVAELTLEKLGDNPKLAQQTVDFFRRPPTAENIELYKQQVESSLSGTYDWKKLSDEQKTDVIYNQHRGFWQLPFEGRSLYLSRILFPTQHTQELDAQLGSVEGQVSHLVDEVFHKYKFSHEKDDALNAIKSVLKDKTGTDHVLAYRDEDWKDDLEGLKKNLTASLNAAYPYETDKVGALLKAVKEPEIVLEDSNPLKTYERPITFADRKTAILNEFFPEGRPYSEEARTGVEAYLNISDIHHQRLLLSAMMVANEPTVDSDGNMHTMRPGEALNHVLGAMGPAGRKLLQAIHSHPSTPQDIKDDIEHSKTMASKPVRWALHKRLEEAGPQATTPDQEIVHVGETLGAGAYAVTVATTKRNGDQTAVTLLRENVRGQAEFEFDNYIRAVQELKKKYPGIGPLLDMVKQAQNMSSVETDMDLARKQCEIAEKLYNNLVIEVDGHKFHFYAAKMVGSGPEYKETEIAPGLHFNDLAVSTPEHPATPEQLSYKKAAAKALLTAELLALVKGGNIDHDRHGGQQRIIHGTNETPVLDQGGHSFVGQFDFGAINPRAPTVADKKALVRVLVGAYRESSEPNSQNANFLTALSQKIDQYPGSEETTDYLNSFKRGLLALGDISKPLDATDMKDVATAVVKNMNIDRTFIVEAARNIKSSDIPQLFSMAKEALSGIGKKRTGTGINIKQNDRSGPPRPKPEVILSQIPQPISAEVEARPNASVHSTNQVENDHAEDPLSMGMARAKSLVDSISDFDVSRPLVGSGGRSNMGPPDERRFHHAPDLGPSFVVDGLTPGSRRGGVHIDGTRSGGSSATMERPRAVGVPVTPPGSTEVHQEVPAVTAHKETPAATHPAPPAQDMQPVIPGELVAPKTPSFAIRTLNAANAPIGFAMGAKGLYDKVNSKEFHEDIKAGGLRSFYATTGATADVANVGVGVIDTAHTFSNFTKTTNVVAEGAEAIEGSAGALSVAGEIAGRAAIPIAVVASAADAGAGWEAKDGHRVARAIGSGAGGILGGMAAGAIVGSVIPVGGTLVGAGIGLVVGIGGAIVGGMVGSNTADSMAGKWVNDKLHENDAPKNDPGAQELSSIAAKADLHAAMARIKTNINSTILGGHEISGAPIRLDPQAAVARFRSIISPGSSANEQDPVQQLTSNAPASPASTHKKFIV